jgi:nucleoside-diphosphate-sugar epimerase
MMFSSKELRDDCLKSCESLPDVFSALAHRHIVVTGGTGFLGTWIAEMIAALNDEFNLGISLDLIARNPRVWEKAYLHLSGRPDIRVLSQDVRAPFEFDRKTHYVIHAAGIPNNRVHASDPLLVFQTTDLGISNALHASTQLDGLIRFLNVSSCLVYGTSNELGALSETRFFPTEAGQLHQVYADAKRAAEQIAAIYRSQKRLPISTLRPFTFTGPYQSLDRPWALNSFLRDVLHGNQIRIHGDGSARRSYLYGSDAAWWVLVALVKGQDGQVYNLGGADPISHVDLARVVLEVSNVRTSLMINTEPSKNQKLDELYPNMLFTTKSLGVQETVSLHDAVSKTYRWFLSMPKG